MTATVTIDDDVIAALMRRGFGQTPSEAIERAVIDCVRNQPQKRSLREMFSGDSPFASGYTNESIEAAELADARHHEHQ